MTAHTQDSPDHAASGTQPAARTTRLRTTRGVLAVVVTAAMYGAVSAAPAVAAEEPQTSGGWARVAHLSPDTKTVDVESVTGSRTNFTAPNTITLPAGPGCIPSSGAQGFTVSDTRIITDAATGRQISSTTRTVCVGATL